MPRFLDELREYLRTEGDVLKSIRETGDLPDEVSQKLEQEIEKFKQGFNVQSESLVG